MTELSPADAGRIHAFCDGIRLFTRFDMSVLQQKPRDLMGPLDWARLGMKMLPFLPTTARYSIVSAEEFAAGFRDPFLRQAVPFMFAWPDVPVMAGLSLLAYMHNGQRRLPGRAGRWHWPAPWRSVTSSWADGFTTSAQVEKILVEDDRAVGVRLYNDEVHRARRGHLGRPTGRTTDLRHAGRQVRRRQHLQRRYDGHLPLYPQLQVSLAWTATFPASRTWTVHLLDEPVLIAGGRATTSASSNYCFDPSLAPAGKSVIVVMHAARDYAYWQRIYGRRLYDTEQDQVRRTSCWVSWRPSTRASAPRWR